MIALDDENANLFQGKLADLLPLIDGEYAEVLERVSAQIGSRVCDEGDLTFALCILQNSVEHCSNKKQSDSKQDSNREDQDKLIANCNELINLISLLLSRQGQNIINGVRR